MATLCLGVATSINPVNTIESTRSASVTARRYRQVCEVVPRSIRSATRRESHLRFSIGVALSYAAPCAPPPMRSRSSFRHLSLPAMLSHEGNVFRVICLHSDIPTCIISCSLGSFSVVPLVVAGAQERALELSIDFRTEP